MIFGNMATTFAMTKEDDLNYQKVIQLLNEMPDFYSGYYMVADDLHIIPLRNGKDIKEILDFTTIKYKKIVIDIPQKYSVSRLNEAFEILRNKRDDLGITKYGIDIRNNGLEVAAKEWTEEKKQQIQQVTNIENITYVTEIGDNSSSQFESRTENTERTATVQKENILQPRKQREAKLTLNNKNYIQNGENKVFLEAPYLSQTGKTMIAAKDFFTMIGMLEQTIFDKTQQEEQFFQVRDGRFGNFQIFIEKNGVIDMGIETWEDDKRNYKRFLQSIDVEYKNDVLFLPMSDMLQFLEQNFYEFYNEIIWDNNEKSILLKTPELFDYDIALDQQVYATGTDTITAQIYNYGLGEICFGEDFCIEKWDGSKWIQYYRPTCIDDVGYSSLPFYKVSKQRKSKKPFTAGQYRLKEISMSYDFADFQHIKIAPIAYFTVE